MITQCRQEMSPTQKEEKNTKKTNNIGNGFSPEIVNIKKNILNIPKENRIIKKDIFHDRNKCLFIVAKGTVKGDKELFLSLVGDVYNVDFQIGGLFRLIINMGVEPKKEKQPKVLTTFLRKFLQHLEINTNFCVQIATG